MRLEEMSPRRSRRWMVQRVAGCSGSASTVRLHTGHRSVGITVTLHRYGTVNSVMANPCRGSAERGSGAMCWRRGWCGCRRPSRSSPPAACAFHTSLTRIGQVLCSSGNITAGQWVSTNKCWAPGSRRILYLGSGFFPVRRPVPPSSARAAEPPPPVPRRRRRSAGCASAKGQSQHIALAHGLPRQQREQWVVQQHRGAHVYHRTSS